MLKILGAIIIGCVILNKRMMGKEIDLLSAKVITT